MTSYLIGYIDAEKINGHEDPMLTEFTYGDLGSNGRKLQNVQKGDFLFFHKTINERKGIYRDIVK